MKRTITVKGVGTASVKPDFVVLSLSVDAKDREYNSALQKASSKVECLQDAIQAIGYEKSDLKTTNFDVRTEYDQVKDKNERYRRVFTGYVCAYRLSLSFDFSDTRLAETLSALSACTANPEMGISFTVKNPAKVSEALLRDAAANARKKAEILCSASGTALGDLLTIDYNWGELNLLSETRYDMDGCRPIMAMSRASVPEIEPDDIQANDTVTFVWEIS